MMRRLALSNWTGFGLGILALALHLAWAISWEPARRGEIVTGFGATLIVLGLLVAARPYIRAGVDQMTAQGMKPLLGNFLMSADQSRAYHAKREAERPQVRRDVWAERVVAVGVVVVGTILNGYGSSLVRLCGWEVQS